MQTNKHTNTLPNRQTNKQTNKHTNKLTNNQTNKRTNRRTNKRINELSTKERSKERTSEQTNERTSKQANQQTNKYNVYTLSVYNAAAAGGRSVRSTRAKRETFVVINATSSSCVTLEEQSSAGGYNWPRVELSDEQLFLLFEQRGGYYFKNLMATSHQSAEEHFTDPLGMNKFAVSAACLYIYIYIYIYLFIFIRSFVHSFVRSFVRSFIHSFIRPSLWIRHWEGEV